jgi:protein-L-isoaspartate(D-aspartate) O-methyltransferase
LLEELRREVPHPRTLSAISRVPREDFVPPDLRPHAYENRPLPIARGQTISQPLMVAAMTAALDPELSDRVLEVGTGSGYQAAVLAEMSAFVVTVERLPELAGTAAVRLADLGYGNIEVEIARPDQLGWPAGAPYERILVTAGAPRVPAELVAQLSIGGRLVVPVGDRDGQELLIVTRLQDGTRVQRDGPCRFVPLVGPGGWPGEPPTEAG